MRTFTALCLLLVASCAHSHPPGAGEIDHVVICWLKDHGNARHQQQIVDASGDLKQIPGVLHVRIGRAVPSTRPIVDSSYDLGMIVRFRDERALHAYDQHPIHQKLRRDLLVPLVGKLVIYDVRVQ